MQNTQINNFEEILNLQSQSAALKYKNDRQEISYSVNFLRGVEKSRYKEGYRYP